MLKYLQFIIFIGLTWIQQSLTEELLWDIKFVQRADSGTPPDNELTLIKGRYSNIDAVLKSIGTTTPINSIGKLNKPEAEIYLNTARASYVLNTMDSVSYLIQMGVSCEAEDRTGYTVQFESVGPFRVAPFKVTTKSAAEPYKFEFLQYNQNLPLFGYGIIYDVLSIENVDQFAIRFKVAQGEGDVSFINDITIPAYNGNPMTQTVRAQFFFTKPPVNNNIVKYDIIYESKCFTGAKSFTMEYKEKEYIPYPELNNNAIFKTLTQETIDIPSSIVVSMVIEYTPVVVYCALQNSYLTPLTEDEIIKQELPESNELRYSYDYYLGPAKERMYFFGLSQFVSYSLRCVFQSITVKEVKSQYVSFGYLSDVKVKVPLFAEKVDGAPPQCLIWTFDKLIAEETFSTAAIPYCYEFLTDYTISRADNGCLSCIKAFSEQLTTQEITQVGICIVSSRDCQTNFKGDITAKAEELKAKLTTSQQLASELKLDPNIYTVKSVVLETDNEAPKAELIKMVDFNLSFIDKRITFKLFTTEKKKIKCDAIVDQRSVVDLIFYDSPQEYEVDIDTPRNQLVYKLNDYVWNSYKYNFMIQCYNLPYIDIAIKKTEPILLKQFYMSQSVSDIKTPTVPIDCALEENVRHIQCLKLAHSSFVSLETEDPREDSGQKIIDYLKKNNYEKRIMLAGETAEATYSSKPLIGNLNQIITVNYLFGVTKCRTYIDYNVCRETEQRLQKMMIDFLNSNLGGSTILNKLQGEGRSEGTFKSNVLLSLQSIFYMTDNSNTFTRESANTLISIMKNINFNLDQIITQINDVPTQRDIVRLIASYLSTFSDVVLFGELDQDYKQIANGTGIIQDEAVNTYIGLVSNFSSQVAKAKLTDLDLEIHSYKIFELSSTVEREDFTFVKGNITVSYPSKYLVESLKAKTIAFTVYDRYYPVRSYLIQDGFDSSAISIRVYNANYDEVLVTGLSSANRFKITFGNREGIQSYCYFYDYNTMTFKSDGITTNDTYVGSTQCETNHLSDFVRLPIKPPFYLAWWAILLIVIASLVVILAAFFFIFKACKKGRSEVPLTDFSPNGNNQLMGNDD